MAQQQGALESALRNFDRIATLLRVDDDRVARQVWRFEFDGQGYLLHFYPRPNYRFIGASPALVQFVRMQSIQRSGIPSPRAVAHLTGFRIEGRLGDALIVEAIPDAIPLDEFLRDSRFAGAPVPQRRRIVQQVIEIVAALGKAKFGHRDLKLENFQISGGNIYLHDTRGLRRSGGLKLNDVFRLAHDAARFATRTELLRGWHTLNPGARPPRKNPLSGRLWADLVARACPRRANDDVGIVRFGVWSGWFTKTPRFACPWSIASRLRIAQADCDAAWPILLAQIESDQLEVIKSDASGDVLAGEVILLGRPIPVIVKRPRRKFWYRYLTDLFRGAKPQRMWRKAWQLIARNIPCEWPMLIVQRRTAGYVTDGLIVFERVPGMTLDRADLDAMPPSDRDRLFRRAGRITRAIERGGLAHYDAKSTNWIVFDDPERGPMPVMIDVDGVRPLNVGLVAWGIQRLLRAMKQHPQYTPEDSLALCQGYAPYAGRIERETPTDGEESSAHA